MGCLCSTEHVVWALHITQRTHAIYNVTACQRAQCLVIYMHPPTKCKSGKTDTSSSHVTTTASITAAWAHLRALRDTGSTCHGTPDLGESPVEPMHLHVHGMPRERDRTMGVCACVGTHRGYPMSNGDKQAIKQTHRMHAQL